jgi:hypothetical protein
MSQMNASLGSGVRLVSMRAVEMLLMICRATHSRSPASSVSRQPTSSMVIARCLVRPLTLIDFVVVSIPLHPRDDSRPRFSRAFEPRKGLVLFSDTV